MSDAAILPAIPSHPRDPFAAEPRFATAGLLVALSLVATAAASVIDPRTFQGANVWTKPMHFQAAVALYLLTLAFFARWLPAGMTEGRRYRIYSGVVVAAALIELVWIGGAAMFGTASHYNRSSALMMGLYPVMGLLAVLLTTAAPVLGVAIWRNRATGLPPALHLAIALGLVLTFVLTLPVATVLANSDGHFVGAPVTGAVVPVMHWSREVGDLRVPHFFATHAMHFLSVAGLLAVALLPERASVPAVWLASLGFVALVAGSFALSLAGLPLVPVF